MFYLSSGIEKKGPASATSGTPSDHDPEEDQAFPILAVNYPISINDQILEGHTLSPSAEAGTPFLIINRLLLSPAD
jgi:hypothetical protein